MDAIYILDMLMIKRLGVQKDHLFYFLMPFIKKNFGGLTLLRDRTGAKQALKQSNIGEQLLCHFPYNYGKSSERCLIGV